MTGYGREMGPASQNSIKLHRPEGVSAISRRIDLEQDFFPTIRVYVANGDGLTGSPEAPEQVGNNWGAATADVLGWVTSAPRSPV